MSVPSSLTFALVTLALGWLALAPLRGRIAPIGYHLAAYPAGLLAFPVVTCVAALTNRGWDLISIGVGLGLYLGAVWALLALLVPTDEAPPPMSMADRRWHGAWTLGVGAVSWIVGATQVTAVGYDSVFHYAAWGMWLEDTGRITAEIAGAYSPLIPSIDAAARTFGLGWLSGPWPILALHAIAIVAIGIFDAGRGLRLWTRLAIAGGAVALMASTAPFLAHSIYLHSHMISAAYLALALWALSRAAAAAAPPDAGDTATLRESATAWCFVAGVATAGLALARPDGLAYALVPLGVAIVWRLSGPRSPRGLAAFLGPLLAMLGLAYGAAFVDTRGWGGDKLTARTAAAVIAGLAVVGLAGMVADRVPVVGARLARGRNALIAAAGLNAVALAALFSAKFPELRATTRIMLGNLTERGGYGSLWLTAAAIIVVSVALVWAWRPCAWEWTLLYALGQFFAVAVVVHGLGHPGRLSPADSFARVAFHAVPLVFWYAGAFAAGLARAWREPASTAAGTSAGATCADVT